MTAVRRQCMHGPGQVRRRQVAGLDIDLVARSASFEHRAIPLSRLEFDLLAMLATDPRRVFPKPELLEKVWGMPKGISTRTLDSHACRLRHKLTRFGGTFVCNRRGMGYSLVPATG
jgi:DNA-binding response OmpR family regulator